jgi:Protein of unknown function (DUF1761)
MISLSFWPIIVASLASFALGALWYSPALFGKEWMTLNGMSDATIAAEAKRGLTKYYVIQFIATIVTFIILGFAVSLGNINTGSAGASIGFFAWIGFILPSGVSSLIWEKKPFRLVLINTVGTLLNLVVGGAIIGAWHA